MIFSAWYYIYSYQGLHLPCTEHVSTSMFVFAMIYLKFKFELRCLMTIHRYSTNLRQACNNSMNRICPAFSHGNLESTFFRDNYHPLNSQRIWFLLDRKRIGGNDADSGLPMHFLPFGYACRFCKMSQQK